MLLQRLNGGLIRFLPCWSPGSSASPLTLRRKLRYFPEGATHMAVYDSAQPSNLTHSPTGRSDLTSARAGRGSTACAEDPGRFLPASARVPCEPLADLTGLRSARARPETRSSSGLASVVDSAADCSAMASVLTA